MLIRRILPNRKLYKSRVNPFDKLISTTPTASPDDNNKATAESAGIFVNSLNLVMPIAAKTETINAVHIGYTFVNNPIAIPPKATCDIASPNNECRLNTKNNPTTEHTREIAAPEIKACCINPNCKISNTKRISHSLCSRNMWGYHHYYYYYYY